MNSIIYNDSIPGEPEICFYIPGMQHAIRLWEGSFDELMRYAVHNADGYWDELALYYHTHTGFYDIPHWEVPSVAVFLDCLKQLPVPPGVPAVNIQRKLIALFLLAADNGLAIRVQYE